MKTIQRNNTIAKKQVKELEIIKKKTLMKKIKKILKM